MKTIATGWVCNQEDIITIGGLLNKQDQEALCKLCSMSCKPIKVTVEREETK